MTWIFWLFITGSFGYHSVYAQGQRVAPGVPPQHYQQQMHQQIPEQVHHQQATQHQPRQHQQQEQFQQAPVHQQIPVQHQQVPVQPHQHVPVQHSQQRSQQGDGHDHGHQQPQQILNAANIAHEKEHIASHFDVPVDTAKMTDQELQFHYFKMHDNDNNNKLDGCELIKSLIHWHEQGTKGEHHDTTVGDKLFKDEELVALIDPILNTDDANGDGFIDYPEFIQAQQKAAAGRNQQN